MKIIIDRKSFKILLRILLTFVLCILGLFLAGSGNGSPSSPLFNRSESVGLILLFCLTYGFDFLYENCRNKKIVSIAAMIICIISLCVIVYAETILKVNFLILASNTLVFSYMLFESIDIFCDSCEGSDRTKVVLSLFVLLVLVFCIALNGIYFVSKSSIILIFSCIGLLITIGNSMLYKKSIESERQA